MTMDDLGAPTQSLYCLEYAAGKEYGSFAIVGKEFAVVVAVHVLAVEIVLVINEIDLHPGRRNGCDLDYKRSVDIIDDDIHTGKAYDFVKLVLPLVDATVARHEGSYLLLPFLDALRKESSDVCDFGFGKIWEYLRIDEQNSFDRFTHNG